MTQTRQEKLDILNKIAKPGQWVEDAKYRQRNSWWISPKQRIHLKYLLIKRWVCNKLNKKQRNYDNTKNSKLNDAFF